MPRAKKPKTVAEVLEESPALKTLVAAREAKTLVEPDAPMPEPQSFAQRLGPRKREVNEPGAIYTGPNIRVTMDADTFMLEAKRPLTTAEQDRIVAIGLDDISEKQDGSLWLGPKSAAAKSQIQLLACGLDGKGERLARSR